MNSRKIFDAITNIDDDLIEETYLRMQGNTDTGLIGDDKIIDEPYKFISTDDNKKVGQGSGAKALIKDDINAPVDTTNKIRSIFGKNNNKKNILYIASGLAAACALIIAYTLLGGRADTTVYASIFMKVNPYVEIDVNKDGEVISLTGLNAEGDELVSAYDFAKKDVLTVSSDMAELAGEEGYLVSNKEITYTIESEDKEFADAYKAELEGISEDDVVTANNAEVLVRVIISMSRAREIMTSHIGDEGAEIKRMSFDAQSKYPLYVGYLKSGDTEYKIGVNGETGEVIFAKSKLINDNEHDEWFDEHDEDEDIENIIKYLEEEDKKKEDAIKEEEKRIEEEKKAAEEAAKEAEKAAEESEKEKEKEAEEAEKEKEKQAEEAEKAAEEAAKEAEKATDEVSKEAEKAAEEAEKEKEKQSEEANKAAEEAAKEAEKQQKEAEKALEEAVKEKEKQAEEAEKAAEEAAKEAEKQQKEAQKAAEEAAKENEKAAEEAEKDREKQAEKDKEDKDKDD